jgi:Polysaccharide deacetylase
LSRWESCWALLRTPARRRPSCRSREIAGHTVDHQRLSALTPDQQHHEICDDATTLRARGYAVNDFAYPHGDGASISSVRSALIECGYVSGRSFGDLYSEGCTNAMVVEGAREIWGLGKVAVDDGGPDGVASTAGNSPFAVQGVFVP